MYKWKVLWSRRINTFPVKTSWVIIPIKYVVNATDGMAGREALYVDHVWKGPVVLLLHIFEDI